MCILSVYTPHVHIKVLRGNKVNFQIEYKSRRLLVTLGLQPLALVD